MNKLGEKSLKTLEYYEILEKLAGQAASQAAKEKCRALRPLDDHEQAELWLQQTTDAKDLMVRQGSPAFGGIREVGAILSRADRGGTLNPRELLAVASLLQTARRALLYDAEHETKTTLTPIFGLLSGNRDLEESITTAIISEEEIADGASPELLSIRRELRRVSGKVRETLNRMISGERSKYLQENIITQRNGRFVVPVKVEHRGDVPGLVHDTSSTGATVFVEPQQVVEINNQIKVLEGREENEIERILAELSSRVSMYKGAIEQDYDALTTLDFIFARAKLSFDMNACAPVLVEDGSRCKLLRARHVAKALRHNQSKLFTGIAAPIPAGISVYPVQSHAGLLSGGNILLACGGAGAACPSGKIRAEGAAGHMDCADLTHGQRLQGTPCALRGAFRIAV